jgi:4-amino-4-deoxy-L-arabinose transferase-like glycosyltransferase
MEASLVLSYCAGVFHTLRWARLDDPARRRRHAVAATLALVLGFMTKFVAVLFLPMTLGVALLLAPRTRERLLADWRTWTACVALFIAVCAPWFVYASVRFGSELWATILGQHVIQRMTAYLDPSHLHPWNYYFVEMWKELSEDRVQWLIVAGLITLLVQTVRRRWLEGAVVLLWAAVPLAIISAATSKVYHYVYPFLPPLALAGGYLVGLIVMLAPVQLRKLLERIEDLFIVKLPALRRLSAPGVRRVATAIVVLASVLAVVTVALGAVRFRLFDTIVRNSGVIRPVSLIVLLAVATGTSARRVRLVIALLVLGVMPVDAYRERLELLPEGKHPVRTAAECLSMVRDQVSSPSGLLIDVPEGVWHPLYYYFRHVRPLASAATPFDPEIERSLTGADAARPILISDAVWHEYAARQRASGAPSSVTSPPMLSFLNTTLLLPGPYAACSSEAVLRSPR